MYNRKYRKIRRSRTDKVIAGVCGGLGEYFSIDPIIFRILFILLVIADGVGILLYILLWLIVPQNNVIEMSDGKKIHINTDKENESIVVSDTNKKYLLGAFMIVIGVVILTLKLFSLKVIWPIALIFIGAYLILKDN